MQERPVLGGLNGGLNGDRILTTTRATWIGLKKNSQYIVCVCVCVGHGHTVLDYSSSNFQPQVLHA